MNRYALVVGINDYADVENIQPLRFAVEDARLVDRFFHACGFEVQALMDSEATCAAIERHLRDLSGRLQPNDLFLFYFSGHGYQWGVRGEERQYLLPRDADLWAMKHGGAGRAVPMRLVQECSGNRGARRVVILDACRSGLSPGEKGDAATEERLATKDIRAMAAAASPASPLVVVCSCRPGQLSYEHGGLRGGLFTNAFLSEFSQLQNAGRPVAFTSETNGAIATRMQHLAEKVHLDPGKVGTFWIEGDATALELLPARSVRPAPAPPTDSADPEKVEVKEWVVEDLEVELERVEVAQPATPSGLPPVPETIVTLRAEIAGLEKAIAELKAGTHPSLKQAQAAVREAELQLQTFQEDLAVYEVSLPPDVCMRLAEAVACEPSLRPSEFCDLAPDLPPKELLPFVARLGNANRAKRALEAVRNELSSAAKRTVAEMELQLAASHEKLPPLEEHDLHCVLRTLRRSLPQRDLMETCSWLVTQLATRGYAWNSRELLKKVEVFLLEQLRDDQEMVAEALTMPVQIENSIGMKFVLIPSGKFLMGSPELQKDRQSDEGPQHQVHITKPFYLAVSPVTQGQYLQLMASNPSSFDGGWRMLLGCVSLGCVLITASIGAMIGAANGGSVGVAYGVVIGMVIGAFIGMIVYSARGVGLSPSRPVENVSWDDAVSFCNVLSNHERRTYRLPTEAEWECACGAARSGVLTYGDDELHVSEYAWYRKNSGGNTHPVGQKRPNGFFLYDMFGNVWEWCADWYASHYYANSPTDDPQGPGSGSERVLRGGCWKSDAEQCRAAFRSGLAPSNSNDTVGFRVAFTAEHTATT